MFDRTACPDAEPLTAQPFVSIDALAALSALLELALKDRTPSVALFSGASRASHDQNRGETHVTQERNAKERNRHNRQPRPQQQMDLFGTDLSIGAIGAPAWPELPAKARAALTNLMTQLILDHAATTATPRAKEVGHDL
jgi:hypothetical protein